MLWFCNAEETKFQVKLKNKKNNAWRNEDISLFMDLDSLSEKKWPENKYEENCKGRFRSNMAKLEKCNRIRRVDTEKDKGVSETIHTYDILCTEKLDEVRSEILNRKSCKKRKKKQNVFTDIRIENLGEGQEMVCMTDETDVSCNEYAVSYNSNTSSLKEHGLQNYCIGEIQNMGVELDKFPVLKENREQDNCMMGEGENTGLIEMDTYQVLNNMRGYECDVSSDIKIPNTLLSTDIKVPSYGSINIDPDFGEDLTRIDQIENNLCNQDITGKEWENIPGFAQNKENTGLNQEFREDLTTGISSLSIDQIEENSYQYLTWEELEHIPGFPQNEEDTGLNQEWHSQIGPGGDWLMCINQ